jgi:NAD(P)-dependent dehydrogenase (short-subunit alcohol dehydrogenase family)
LQKLKSEITSIAPTATVETVQTDLGSITDIERLAAITLEACGGRLDILVNNASTLGPVPMPYLLDYPVDDFQQVLNVNLVAFTADPELAGRDDRPWRIHHKRDE